MKRQSGISVPLSALVGTESWGIGEFQDLATFARWAAAAGQSLVQILPINELPAHERSPYSAMTAMALDPIHVSLPAVPDFEALGRESGFDADDHYRLEYARDAERVAFSDVRQLKDRWLRRSWERFHRIDVPGDTPRARRFHRFIDAESWWLDEYAFFRALLARHRDRHWSEWPAELAESGGANRARHELHTEMQYRRYLQWVAAEQWADARRRAWPTRIFGDLPFMITGNSADVWSRQRQFRFDATVGAPPDAFSETGQDWGLPPWRWDVMRQDGYAWMAARARRYAALFDGYRIDHLVGLYRTFVRPIDETQPAFFDPPDEPTQLEVGEAIIRTFLDAGAEVIAEDLGSVPAFVRTSISRLGVPGFKVLRWERHWDQPDHPLIDPREFAELSVATTGTHDVEPVGPELRAQSVQELLLAGSYLTLVPIQDVFGWTDRINTPNLVDEANWTWRVPQPVNAWRVWPEAIERSRELRDWTRASGR